MYSKSELRLGSIVKRGWRFFKVTGLKGNEILYVEPLLGGRELIYDVKEFTGVTLTQDWFGALGFELIERKNLKEKNGPFEECNFIYKHIGNDNFLNIEKVFKIQAFYYYEEDCIGSEYHILIDDKYFPTYGPNEIHDIQNCFQIIFGYDLKVQHPEELNSLLDFCAKQEIEWGRY